MNNTDTLKSELNQFRNERKFIFYESVNYIDKYFNSLGAIQQFPDRKVNSIYFDTYNLKDLINAIEGINLRSKTRLRWYGDTFNTVITPKLEKKIKKNNQNFKISYPISSLKVNKYFHIKKFNDFINSEITLNDDLYFDVKSRQFNVFVSYKRKYLVIKNLRITIDFDLCFLNLNKISSFSINYINSLNQKRIVEIKYLDGHHDEINDITKMFSNRLTKFSKYQAGFYETF